ncbi:MAG: radical SAM protein [Syntrophotaleaceae bacterium]
MSTKSCSGTGNKSGHPCFGGNNHQKAGRIHLAVAPGCNIKCGFCERRFDCANENRPGVTSKVLTPGEAVQRVRQVMAHPLGGPNMRVVGIAGPGDPLANQNTFATFRLVKEAFPQLMLCLSTNGLLLPDRIDELKELGVHSVTVTVNALTPETGARVYQWVQYQGARLKGEDAAKLLLEKQFQGIEAAVAAGMLVKVNSVYIPGVNDHETLPLAVAARKLGATMMNILPLIPQGIFKDRDRPSDLVMDLVRNQAESILSQARHCGQCRADAAGLIGQDIDLNTLQAPVAKAGGVRFAG